MAEGGLLSWKRQTVKQNGPVADYSRLRLPLPPPPEGQSWQKNESTKEWSLVGNKQGKLSRNDKKSSSTSSKSSDYESRIKKLQKEDLGDIDYLYHVVLPSDTFQGLCLTYKITSTRLRQVNMFSGSNLKLAPKKLIIPVKKALLSAGKIRMQDRTSKEFKINEIQAVFPEMGNPEAKYYLDMVDQDVEKAIDEARSDIDWEKEILQMRMPGKFFPPLENESNLDEKTSVTYIVDEAIPVQDIQDNSGTKSFEKRSIEMTPLINK